MHEETLQLHLTLLQQSEKEKGKKLTIIYLKNTVNGKKTFN
jgi:hypothetical protein